MNHIIGKVYDVTSENMNKLIAEVEKLQAENEELKRKGKLYLQTLDDERDANKRQYFNLEVKLDKANKNLVWLVKHAMESAILSKAKASELLDCSLIDFDKTLAELEK